MEAETVPTVANGSDATDLASAPPTSASTEQPPDHAGAPKVPKSDKIDRLQANALKNAWSVDGWTSYINEAVQRADPAFGRDAYESFLKTFPTSYRHWIAYIEFEQRHRAFDRVEELFKRCLPTVVSVELWRFYLNYIKKTHAVTPTSTPTEKTESRRVISETFEFVLLTIGQDKDSGSIWLDYIQFIKSGETTNTYEEQQRMDTLRKVYHRALGIPLSNVEAIWKEYDSFENGLNKITAKKLLMEKSASYMTARSAYRDLKTRMTVIDAMQKQWNAMPPTWTSKEQEVLQAWKNCIIWEKSNPLHLEDNTLLISRIMYTFKSSLLMLRFFPEIWYEAAEYLLSIGKAEDAVLLLTQATEIIPQRYIAALANSQFLIDTSALLTFSLCEIEENLKRDGESISKVYEALIKSLEDGVDTTNAKFDQERIELLAILNRSDPEDSEADWDGERREREREKQRENEREVEVKVESRRKEEIEKLKTVITLSWIVYMRFARRSQVWRRIKDVNVATKIFEAGLKAFTDDESLAGLFERYLEFLISVDDQNNGLTRTAGSYAKGAAKAKPQAEQKPEKYPRPDFSKWNIYKPEPPPPSAMRPAPNAEPSVPTKTTPLAPPVPSYGILPDAINKFLELLPPASSYTGPIIPVNDVIDLLRHIPLQIGGPGLIPLAVPPPRQPPMPDIPPRHQERDRLAEYYGASRSYPDRDRNDRMDRVDRDRNGGGRFPPRGGRGGSRGGGGGGGSYKRKGGHDSDDDDFRRYPDSYGGRNQRGRRD
ncbi:mRNA 3'-end-processing protein rna14 [Phlyctochytrium planicorne]|nr:mRNA 3'-end-processing protein rna14 [Phlyctochytrium planicorne]